MPLFGLCFVFLSFDDDVDDAFTVDFNFVVAVVAVVAVGVLVARTGIE